MAVRDLPGLLSSGSYQPAKSNLSLGIGTEQFLPSTRTFQKFSSPSPVNKNMGLKNVTVVLKMATLATSGCGKHFGITSLSTFAAQSFGQIGFYEILAIN